jgi:tetratricopeptide (TPR) repeat protein
VDARHERKALVMGQRAVALDPLDARNHLIVAWAHAMTGAHEQAAVHYELAVSLNPNDSKLLLSCAQGLGFTGFKSRARALLAEAFELAPSFLDYQWCYIASTRYMLGDYSGAVEAAARGNNATLDTPGWRAACLSLLGNDAEAKQALIDQVELVQPLWTGAARPTAGEVTAWFLSAFPIAKEQDRLRVKDALGRIASD